MNLEGRKSNIYFDQTGRQILVGDLLKIFHFRTRGRIHYMHHMVVMEESDFPVMAIQAYYAEKPHCRMYVLADNDQRVFLDGKIVAEKDFQAKRQRIKVSKPVKQ